MSDRRHFLTHKIKVNGPREFNTYRAFRRNAGLPTTTNIGKGIYVPYVPRGWDYSKGPKP